MTEREASFDDIKNIFKEVCELSSDECKGAIDEYEKHGNKLKLVVDVFKAIGKCDTEKCNTNKDEIYSKLNVFLRMNT